MDEEIQISLFNVYEISRSRGKNKQIYHGISMNMRALLIKLEGCEL